MSQSWAQLTYTSSDSGPGTGGWGVKDTAGGHDELLERMRAGVTTLIEEVTPTPSFATAAELEARPRKLTFTLEGEDVLLWHAASAGPDATGRPGNVFTHAASYPTSAAPQARPIAYWRSPDWLAPYGALEVGAARLGVLVRAGEAITRESVLTFIRASAARRNSLEWLLAAVDHALSGGPSLVVGVNSVDEAASWIGAVSHLTAPALARRLSWTTFERGSTLPDSVRQGLKLLFVPRQDLDEFYAVIETRDTGLLVLDPEQELGDPLDGLWHTGQQSFASAPRWQDAMLDLFALDESRAERVLEDMDAICANLTRTEALALPMHWPLSVAMLPVVPLEDEARANRIDVLLADAPQSSVSHEVIQQLLAERPEATTELSPVPPSGAQASSTRHVGVSMDKPSCPSVPRPALNIGTHTTQKAVAHGPSGGLAVRRFGLSQDGAAAPMPPTAPTAPPAVDPVIPVVLNTVRLETMVSDHASSPTAAVWLLKALEAVLGLEPLSFDSLTLPAVGVDSAALAEQLLQSDSSSDVVRAAAAHWLASYWLLQTAQPEPSPPPAARLLTQQLRRHEDLIFGAIAHDLQSAPVNGARIILASCLPEARGSRDTIQMLSLGGTVPFGRMIARRALSADAGVHGGELALAIVDAADRKTGSWPVRDVVDMATRVAKERK